MNNNEKTEEQIMATSIPTSVDLWKFFEERGAKLKENMFKVVTWIIGFAAIVLGYTVKEGFAKGLVNAEYPGMVICFSLIGLLLLGHAVLVIRDYGEHINRTFNRAEKAMSGESLPKKIWEAGEKAKCQNLPPVCRHLLVIVSFFGAGFFALTILALKAL